MSSDSLDAAIEKLGRTLSPAMLQGTAALFANKVARATPDFCTVERDLRYGPDERHRLDVFQPNAAGAKPAPVLIFVHGGGFISGDKGGPDAPFYNHVGAWAVRHGLIGVTMTYRLAPGAPWPAGAADIAGALAWLGGNIARFGGDPAQIFLMGQSAGAVHVAGYLAGHHGSAKDAPSLAGAIMLSGLYDLVSLEHSPFEHAYFGTDAAQFPVRSSLDALLKTEVPCLFALAEFDPPNFQQQAIRLVEAHLAAKGAWPRLLYLLGQNHLSELMQLTAPTDNLGPSLASFIARFARKDDASS